MPDIHEWWPQISIEAKHSLREHEGEIVPKHVRKEITEITGERRPDDYALSADETDFIRTQQEAVD